MAGQKHCEVPECGRQIRGQKSRFCVQHHGHARALARNAHRANGLCLCGRDPKPGRASCPPCLDRRQRNRKPKSSSSAAAAAAAEDEDVEGGRRSEVGMITTTNTRGGRRQRRLSSSAAAAAAYPHHHHHQQQKPPRPPRHQPQQPLPTSLPPPPPYASPAPPAVSYGSSVGPGFFPGAVGDNNNLNAAAAAATSSSWLGLPAGMLESPCSSGGWSLDSPDLLLGGGLLPFGDDHPHYQPQPPQQHQQAGFDFGGGGGGGGIPGSNPMFFPDLTGGGGGGGLVDPILFDGSDGQAAMAPFHHPHHYGNQPVDPSRPFLLGHTPLSGPLQPQPLPPFDPATFLDVDPAGTGQFPPGPFFPDPAGLGGGASPWDSAMFGGFPEGGGL